MELQRQEDMGMVVQDLLPGSLFARSQFHQHTTVRSCSWASHLHPTAKLGPICPGKAIIK